jgi:3-hydroxyisobutyrate dehydrogenase
MASKYSQVGFVGLGAMGKHMAEQLAIKLPEKAQLFIFDVSKAPVEELMKKYPGRIIGCTSPKDVAEKSVCWHQKGG